jgi:general secretion pathway protein M
MKNTFTQWWNARTNRERSLVKTMAAVVLLFVLLNGMVLPLIQNHQAYAVSLPALRASVNQLHSDADEAIALRQQLGGAASTAFQSLGPGLAAYIEQSASEAGMKGQIQSINKLDNGQVEVILPRVNFNHFLMWADHLKRTVNVGIHTLNATGLDHAGGVQLRVILQQVSPAS